MKPLLLGLVLFILGSGASPVFSQIFSSAGPSVNNVGQPVAATMVICTAQPAGINPPGECSATRAQTFTDVTLTVPCTLTSLAAPLPTPGPISGAGCTNPGNTDTRGNYVVYAQPTPTGLFADIYGYQIKPYVMPFGLSSTGAGTGNVFGSNLTLNAGVFGAGGSNIKVDNAISTDTLGGLTTAMINGVYNAFEGVGADECQKINSVMLAHPGATIDARQFTGTQSCTTMNPFTGQTASFILLLGNSLIQTTKPWVTKSSVGPAYIIGSGRGNLAAFPGQGTTIEAVAGFPATCDGLSTGCPVIRLGDFSGGTNGAFGHRIESLTIDCNSQAGGIGLYSNDIQEQSGAIHFAILRCPVYGVYMDGSFGAGKGAENYTLYDGEVASFGATTTNTVHVKIVGSGLSRVAARIIENVTTSSGQVSPQAAAGFQFTNGGMSTVRGLNSELNTIGYDIGPAGAAYPVVGMHLDYVTCGSGTSVCVWIHTGSNSISATEINNGSGNTTVQDDTALPSGNTITDGVMDYATGDNGNFRYTTSHYGGNSGVGNLMPLLILNNTTSASSILSMTQPTDNPVVVSLNSGVTAAQGQSFVFNDRGTGKWTVQNTGSSGGAGPANAFQIFDQAANIPRMFMANGTANTGYITLNAIATGEVAINTTANSGTGGLRVGSGGAVPTDVLRINGAGALSILGSAGFTGTKVAGACTFTIVSGIITNVTGC